MIMKWLIGYIIEYFVLLASMEDEMEAFLVSVVLLIIAIVVYQIIKRKDDLCFRIYEKKIDELIHFVTRENPNAKTIEVKDEGISAERGARYRYPLSMRLSQQHCLEIARKLQAYSASKYSISCVEAEYNGEYEFYEYELVREGEISVHPNQWSITQA